MQLTVLGSGGIHPDLQRSGPAHLVSEAGEHMLLDLGSGALRGLKAQGLSPADLGAVCVTHRHPDHVGELNLLLELEQAMGRSRPLGLAGPAILDDYLAFFATWGREERRALSYPIDRAVLPESEASYGPFSISGRTMPHVPHSVGLRIASAGRVLVYPGDCGPGSAVVDLARGADVLLLECTLPPEVQYEAHLNAAQAAEIALAAGVARLVLTHFSPNVDAAEAVDICRHRGVAAEAAFDGLSIEV